MIKSTKLTTTGDTEVYRSTTTGDNLGTGNRNAITNMIICNTGSPSSTDETVNNCTLTVNLVRFGQVSNDTNTIVKNLIVPAGETVFFSDEKIILEDRDQIRMAASVGNLLSVTVSSLEV